MFKHDKVKPFRRNWDIDCIHDIINGNGFYVDEPAQVLFDGTKENTLHGVRSPLFGANYSDEQAFVERYRCKCGTFTSRLFEGDICPNCGHEVKAETTNLEMTAWIPVKSPVINPYYYQLLSKVCGKKPFEEIVYSKFRVTKNGKQVKLQDEDYEEKPKTPFAFIGIEEFEKRYEEILLYFANIKKHKRKAIRHLIDEKQSVFTHHIPVYSTVFRPQSITSDTFYYETVDKIINTMVSLSMDLEDCEPIEKDYIIERLQGKLTKYWDEVFKLIDGKKGIIRGQLFGSELNYTSRAVIVPDPSLRDDQVDIPYNDARVKLREQIMYRYMRIHDTTLSEAYKAWERSITFDQEIYDIMMDIVEDVNKKTIINRNPSLKFASVCLMKIRKIKTDPNDYTLSVPLGIIKGMNADFDGDQINMIIMIDEALNWVFRKFEPVKRMIIDRDSGNLSSSFALDKGQLINLYYFATVGATENDEPELYEDENGEYTLTEPLKK